MMVVSTLLKFLFLGFSIILTSWMTTNKLYYKLFDHNFPLVTLTNFIYLDNTYKALNIISNIFIIWMESRIKKSMSFKVSLSTTHAKILFYFITYNVIYL